jgi:hypothetical protein
MRENKLNYCHGLGLPTIGIFRDHCGESEKKVFIERRRFLKRFNRRDFSSSCSTAVFGTERVFIERRVIGAVVDTFEGSVDEEGVSCDSLSVSSLISSIAFRFGLILFVVKLLFIEFFGEK